MLVNVISRIRKKLHRISRAIRQRKAEAGPYHFLIKNWAALEDIDLAADVLGTQFFRERMQPVEVIPNDGQRVVVLAPHQDDETIGAGGTLVRAARLGAKVDIVFMTDGEQQQVGKGWEDSIRIRDCEAEEACAHIPGATIHRFGISNQIPRPSQKDITRLGQLLHRLSADIVMVPWLLDLPAKHRMINHLFALAEAQYPLPDARVWGYQVHNSIFPNVYVDITEVMSVKRNMLACYRSQNESKRFDHLIPGLNAWNARFISTLENKYLELFFVLPAREYTDLVKSKYENHIQQVYRNEPELAAHMGTLHYSRDRLPLTQPDKK
jgi:LmbE family N-acetylglucosaminyl deacetylase